VRLPWGLPLRRRHEHLLIACFPKSGSTYLSKVLREMTGFTKAYVSEPGPQNEQDLCAAKLTRLRHRSVMQQHVKATRTNLELLIKLGLRPIVQTRNLYDVVVSLHDHFEPDHRSLPCGFVSENYLRMAWNERIDYLIHVHLPWYFNFVLSWREAAQQIDVCPVTYEQFFADQPGELARIAAFYGIRASAEQVAQAMARAARANTRFNVGIAGRGAEMLTPRHKLAIHHLAGICRIDVSQSGSIAPFAEPHRAAA
jgi:hypothetical protein